MSICNILQNYSYIDINTIDTSNFTEENYKIVVLNDIHVIDFNNLVSKTPFFFKDLKKKNNKLFAGDIDCSQNIIFSNEKYKGYNVFYCAPFKNKSYTYKNIFKNLHLLYKEYNKYGFLICIINIQDKNQSNLFTKIFKDFFIEYKVIGNNFELDFNLVQNILKLNGKYYLLNTSRNGIQLKGIDTILSTIQTILIDNSINSISEYEYRNNKIPYKIISCNTKLSKNNLKNIESLIDNVTQKINYLVHHSNLNIKLTISKSNYPNPIIKLIYYFKVYSLIFNHKNNLLKNKSNIELNITNNNVFNFIVYYFFKKI